MADVKVEVKGKGANAKLVIEIPCTLKPNEPSGSGKTLRVASTNGNIRVEGVEVDDKPLFLGVNAYVKNPNYKKD